MEKHWPFSTPTLFNTVILSLDDKNKVAREMNVIIDEMTNVLEHFGADLQLQKNEAKESLKLLLQQPLKTLHAQEKISVCKGKDNPDVTKLRN